MKKTKQTALCAIHLHILGCSVFKVNSGNYSFSFIFINKEYRVAEKAHLKQSKVFGSCKEKEEKGAEAQSYL